MFKNPELRTAFNASDDTKSALDIFHLEAEPTRRLMDFCEKYHVSWAACCSWVCVPISRK